MTQYLGYEINTETLTARGVSRITRTCNRTAGDEIREQLPEHFEENAQQKFKYRRRSRIYNERKRRLFGHTRPLVFRGNLRRAVLTSARVTATQHRARVPARGSRQSNLTKQHRDEIEIVTKRKERQISRNWRDNFVSLADQSQFKKRSKR